MCQLLKILWKKQTFQGTKKGDEISSQQYEQEMTVLYKRKKITTIGKKESIDLYDEGKINTPQDNIPRYDGGMWGNIWMPI